MGMGLSHFFAEVFSCVSKKIGESSERYTMTEEVNTFSGMREYIFTTIRRPLSKYQLLLAVNRILTSQGLE